MDLERLLISISGVLFGAVLGFWINRRLKKLDDIEEQKSKCRLAAYILYKQYEDVLEHFETHMAPYMEHPHRSEVMPPIKYKGQIGTVEYSEYIVSAFYRRSSYFAWNCSFTRSIFNHN